MSSRKIRSRRSDCPVNFAVEALGDKWSLVILRDMIFWGKRTFGEFLKSDEKIATNILASRLAFLEEEGLISKSQDPADKRKEIYTVTEMGIALVPMLIEMIAWSAGNVEWLNMPHCGTPEQIAFVQEVATTENRSGISRRVQELVRSGGYVFEGVVRQEVFK